MNAGEIISIVVGIIAIIAGIKWMQLKTLIREIAQAFDTLSNAIEDDNVTSDEAKSILKEFGDVAVAVAKLLKRK